MFAESMKTLSHGSFKANASTCLRPSLVRSNINEGRLDFCKHPLAGAFRPIQGSFTMAGAVTALGSSHIG